MTVAAAGWPSRTRTGPGEGPGRPGCGTWTCRSPSTPSAASIRLWGVSEGSAGDDRLHRHRHTVATDERSHWPGNKIAVESLKQAKPRAGRPRWRYASPTRLRFAPDMLGSLVCRRDARSRESARLCGPSTAAQATRSGSGYARPAAVPTTTPACNTSSCTIETRGQCWEAEGITIGAVTGVRISWRGRPPSPASQATPNLFSGWTTADGVAPLLTIAVHRMVLAWATTRSARSGGCLHLTTRQRDSPCRTTTVDLHATQTRRSGRPAAPQSARAEELAAEVHRQAHRPRQFDRSVRHRR